MRVLLFGTFDDLHPGHRYVFDRALERGDVTVVVARDENVTAGKGRPPLQLEMERVQAIRDAYPDMTVVLGHHTDYLRVIEHIAPDLILLGYDQSLPPGVTEEMLGVPIERLDAFEPHIHKSSIRRKEKERARE